MVDAGRASLIYATRGTCRVRAGRRDDMAKKKKGKKGKKK
jgi:hypothetical protein